jgi:hypothetical protein
MDTPHFYFSLMYSVHISIDGDKACFNWPPSLRRNETSVQHRWSNRFARAASRGQFKLCSWYPHTVQALWLSSEYPRPLQPISASNQRRHSPHTTHHFHLTTLFSGRLWTILYCTHFPNTRPRLCSYVLRYLNSVWESGKS